MIPIAEPLLGEEELNNVIAAVKSGWISSKGKFIPEFEEGLARYCGVEYGVATSNGTTALHLALTALGIGRGDEVIVPTLTFIATANAVRYTGAKPVLVDSHPDYWCLDPDQLQEVITPRTKAIIPVHLYGHPCDMNPIMDVAKSHNLYVIEDAAEAHGTAYRGKRVGSFGDIACFSFYGNKIITTGEGGMCVTSNEHLAEKMRVLRDHGMNPGKRYWHDVIGFNYRMTNIQAGIGVAQLARSGRFIEKRREIARWYAAGLKELEAEGRVKLPPEMPWAERVDWVYSILVQDDLGTGRDELMNRLELAGIEVRPLFYPVHMMPPYKTNKRFPVAEELSRRGISLPFFVNLTEEQVKYITDTIRKS